MNLNPAALLSRHTPGFLLATLLGLPLALSCSDEEAAPPPPLDFSLAVTALEPGPGLPQRCDGTMAITVAITSPSELAFTLRPRHACGTSNRCGYVHIEAFDAAGDAIASVDTVTTVGLLSVPPAALGDFVAVRASLLRGVDGEPVVNADGSEVTTTVEVSSPAPGDCSEPGAGGAGQGGGPAQGDGGAAPQGGVASGGAPSAAAGAAGSPDSSSAGQGGVASAGAPGGGVGGN